MSRMARCMKTSDEEHCNSLKSCLEKRFSGCGHSSSLSSLHLNLAMWICTRWKAARQNGVGCVHQVLHLDMHRGKSRWLWRDMVVHIRMLPAGQALTSRLIRVLLKT